MNAEEFRKYGRQMVDYIADYLENILERKVVHSVSPGYLKDLLPKEAPVEPEDFDEVFKDIEKYIMPGVCSVLNCLLLSFNTKASNHQFKLCLEYILTKIRIDEDDSNVFLFLWKIVTLS